MMTFSIFLLLHLLLLIHTKFAASRFVIPAFTSLRRLAPPGDKHKLKTFKGFTNDVTNFQQQCTRRIVRYEGLSSSFTEPSKEDSQFGRQSYWDGFYKETESFSWYTGWADLEPFVRELLPDQDSQVLIPGVGNDATLVDMYDSGYHKLTAFDYAPEGISCCKVLLGDERVKHVNLFVGDARNLTQFLQDESFDAVLEKGTLDAIHLSGGGSGGSSGGSGGDFRQTYLDMAISELARVIRPGGYFMSVSAVCTELLQESAFWKNSTTLWEPIQDGTLHVTEDGYASNNFDGTWLVWQKKG